MGAETLIGAIWERGFGIDLVPVWVVLTALTI